jgi:hypothetical protein
VRRGHIERVSVLAHVGISAEKVGPSLNSMAGLPREAARSSFGVPETTKESYLLTAAKRQWLYRPAKTHDGLDSRSIQFRYGRIYKVLVEPSVCHRLARRVIENIHVSGFGIFTT